MIALVLPNASAAAEKLPAPEYFVTTVMETSTAQMLAVNCPSISINPIQAASRSEEVLVRLTEDGFEPSNLETRMADPSDAIAVLQDAFVAKHGLSGQVTQELICAAGQREIDEGTGIGRLLFGVAQ